ncbi:unnamed protein product [Effrenium voratum]|nr:unnamed protein product [Effrenium voratum]
MNAMESWPEGRRRWARGYAEPTPPMTSSTERGGPYLPGPVRPSSTCTAPWPEAPIGRGPWPGPPRGAGIVAFQEDRVCLVESRNGKLSFPKGGKKKSDKSVIDCAFRELLEETSIPRNRVMLHEGLHVDEEKFGCRYLLAEVLPSESDMESRSWTPRHEDPADKDPVVKAHWAPLVEVLAGSWPGLHPGRALRNQVGRENGADAAERVGHAPNMWTQFAAKAEPCRTNFHAGFWRRVRQGPLYSAVLKRCAWSAEQALGEQPMQLQYSRAFGAKDLKIFGLSSAPDVRTIRMGSSPKVKCLILASDGLWDVISTQEATRICQEEPAHLAEALVHAALREQAKRMR